MPVYVGDNQHGCLMIKKIGAQWYVYRLKEVQVKYSSYGFHPDFHKYKSIKFIFEKTATAKHGYKPYDDDDVTKNPNVLFDHVRRMAHHKVRVMT